MKNDNERVANIFVLQAIQEWGQSEKERIAAVQGVLDAAGFNATATCWPVFGGIWPKQCTGKDAEEASKWLTELTNTMRRGRYEDEVRHVTDALRARQAHP